jgi:hypothetical protein
VSTALGHANSRTGQSDHFNPSTRKSAASSADRTGLSRITSPSAAESISEKDDEAGSELCLPRDVEVDADETPGAAAHRGVRMAVDERRENPSIETETESSLDGNEGATAGADRESDLVVSRNAVTCQAKQPGEEGSRTPRAELLTTTR